MYVSKWKWELSQVAMFLMSEASMLKQLSLFHDNHWTQLTPDNNSEIPRDKSPKCDWMTIIFRTNWESIKSVTEYVYFGF